MAKQSQSKRGQVRPAAATAEVVGRVGAGVRIPRKWKEHYRHLVDLHALLLNQKDGLSRDARMEKQAFSLHMADAGTDNYDQDFALSMMSSEQDALYEIEEAINRIREGTYGICELSGKPIEPVRLNAIPWTRFSTEAEKQLEREGAVPRTRLAPRETVPRTERAAEATEEKEEEETGGTSEE